MKTITQDEFLAEAKARFGPNARDWKFVCPACGTIQSVQQLLDAVLATGGTKDDVHGYIGFSCVGRFTGQGDAGIAVHNRGEKWDKGCNWTLGGLFRIHTLEVVMPDGGKRPTFELAPKPQSEWNIGYADREFAREHNDPVLAVVEADTKEEAERIAAATGVDSRGAGLWAWPKSNRKS